MQKSTPFANHKKINGGVAVDFFKLEILWE